MSDINCPPILYHYTSIPAFKNIIRKRQFWLTHYKYVEDNSELIWGVKIAEEIVAKKLSQPGTFNEQLRNLLSLVPQDFYIGCFCLRNDNEYLWERYAKGGVVIGFDTKYWLEQPSVQLTPVSYKTQDDFRKMCENAAEKLKPFDIAPPPKLKEIAESRDFEKFKAELHAVPEWLTARDIVANLAAEGTLMKDPRYRPEEEWRLFNDPSMQQKLTYIVDKHGRKRAIFDFRNDPLPIVEIKFRDSMEEVSRKGIDKFLVKSGFNYPIPSPEFTIQSYCNLYLSKLE